MTAAVLTQAPPARPRSAFALDAAARLWFAAAVAGQGAFIVFIVGFYLPTIVTGHFEAWRRNSFLIKGYVAGDNAGNLAFAAHVVMAAVVTFGGLLQLVPQVRARAPAVHRWNGRLFLVASSAAALDGLWMHWVRGARGGPFSSTAINIDALLILGFGAMAWRTARAGDYRSHRVWALRTFMVANGVWFLRVGYIAWGISVRVLTGAMPDMGGAFGMIWPFGCYLLPLAALELYLCARRTAEPAPRIATASLILVLTVLMAFGSIGAWLFFWAPVLAKA